MIPVTLATFVTACSELIQYLVFVRDRSSANSIGGCNLRKPDVSPPSVFFSLKHDWVLGKGIKEMQSQGWN